MEFWGVEVKPGQTVTCDPGVDRYLHLSQASLGELKKDKGSASVPIYVNVDDKKLVLGTLSQDKCAQIQYDLVFEKEFKLSHGGKDGSIFFLGYRTLITEDMPGGYSDTDSEEEPHLIPKANGKPAAKEESKPAPKASLQRQQKAAEEAVKANLDESDDEDESDDNESDEEESGDEDESDEEMGDGSDDEDESSEEEEKITPKKPESGKKRLLDSDSKASVSDKKAKFVTPAKAEGKKGGGHVATPYPSKQSAKTQGSEGKKQQTPKSGGAFSCKSCSKSFGSENAVQSHSKAKHGGQ